MKLSLPVESVRERDIDFLLIEEFLSSKLFVDFFVATLNLPPCTTIASVERSINDFGLGETDVFVQYMSDQSQVGILIENKLDASFQPDQALRYSQRAHALQESGSLDATFVVLVAPHQYIEQQIEFSRCLSYEQLVAYFQNSTLAQRGVFKAQLLTIAAEKLRRGYVAANFEPNQIFWRAYRERLMNTVPEIFMKPVGTVPVNSDWIDLSIGSAKCVHKLSKGYLDFTHLSPEHTLQLEQHFGEAIERIAFKSGETIRIHTAPLDRNIPLEKQLSSFDICAKDLRRAAAFTPLP